jgi:hypothetical protein
LTSLIKRETQKALDSLKISKSSLASKDLISHMTAEIQRLMDQGDWNFAVRLSFYRHEFAKISKNLDWYAPYLEIRKIRDKIQTMLGDHAPYKNRK